MRWFSTSLCLHGEQGKNIPVAVTIRTILIFVEDLDGSIFPLLGDLSRSPHVDRHVVKAS